MVLCFDINISMNNLYVMIGRGKMPDLLIRNATQNIDRVIRHAIVDEGNGLLFIQME